ncbi:response regulator [Desulfofustis glycolicus]|uniref:Response regulator receiver domain-containing protein n=1 Tax=Desulfofustis glycolicus DSM 9705 TaxID=1121409 RepID=A0A1M5X9J1_9BACT|nr:response regulator [Desulfofustis glycolicus]MCB2218158.1 response regulator [Desulfobulbaceae bacterium]SHH96461.1 Response regulator receiver domain-containing protein [Desulfofustis glycolicus DSM 9705]
MIQATNKPTKVLIADDEVEFASTLMARLQLRDFSVEAVNSGKATLEAIAKDLPDVVLLDLKMPDLDGLEVLARIRQDHPELTVFILTGHGSFEAGKEGMKLGANDYIMKPVDLNRLIKKMEDALGS